MAQPLTGSRSSTPKSVKITGDDSLKVIYRNLGNNHAYPFLWADSVTFSGTELVLASGVKFHGYDLATYANVQVTPKGDPVGRMYVTANTATNVLTLVSTSSVDTAITVDVLIMLGVDPDITTINCRGNTGAQPSLP